MFFSVFGHGKILHWIKWPTDFFWGASIATVVSSVCLSIYLSLCLAPNSMLAETVWSGSVGLVLWLQSSHGLKLISHLSQVLWSINWLACPSNLIFMNFWNFHTATNVSNTFSITANAHLHTFVLFEIRLKAILDVFPQSESNRQ